MFGRQIARRVAERLALGRKAAEGAIERLVPQLDLGHARRHRRRMFVRPLGSVAAAPALCPTLSPQWSGNIPAGYAAKAVTRTGGVVRSRPIVVPNPAGDGAFAGAVEAELAKGEMDADELQRRLRVSYPQAVVRPRALTGELVEIWYAYRDGHWTAPAD